MTVSNATPNLGSTVTFTVTVTNSGSSPATNVTVNDVLPIGLKFVSATPSQGAYDNNTGIWTVGTVDPGSPVTLVISAEVLKPGGQTNTAMILHSDQFDPNLSNNAGTSALKASPPVPALSTGAMILLVSCLGLVGIGTLRRTLCETS